MKEIWKPIKDYEGLYEVSNLGRVKSLRNNITLKPEVKNGYSSVNLCKEGCMKHRYIHRLVAEAFIENPNKYKCINHINCDKQNNKVDNLEWCSQKHNIKESIKNNLQHRVKPVKVEKIETGERYKFLTMKEASNFMFNHDRKLSRLKEYYGNQFIYGGWFVKVGDENVIN